jgi:hypothetical protein
VLGLARLDLYIMSTACLRKVVVQNAQGYNIVYRIPTQLDILYEDTFLLAVNKPGGVVSHFPKIILSLLLSCLALAWLCRSLSLAVFLALLSLSLSPTTIVPLFLVLSLPPSLSLFYLNPTVPLSSCSAAYI